VAGVRLDSQEIMGVVVVAVVAVTGHLLLLPLELAIRLPQAHHKEIMAAQDILMALLGL
jgi:hypothetical protein